MRISLLILVMSAMASCKTVNDKSSTSQRDIKTQSIIDASVDAMGGYDRWDGLHAIAWKFFGFRDLLWDKNNNRVRIDSPRDSSVYLLNMDDMSGRVLLRGEEVVHPDSLGKYLNVAKRIWINDSYWLAMPFKLEDPGVTTKYVRNDTTLTGIDSEVLQLTFDGVGVSPQNKYDVYVDIKSRLILQWAFYRDANQETAPAIWPWDNYKEYNGVLISGDRSDGRGPSNIKVFDSLEDSVFEEFALPKY